MKKTWTDIGFMVDERIDLDKIEIELGAKFGFSKDSTSRLFRCTREDGVQVELHEHLFEICIKTDNSTMALASFAQPKKRTLHEAAKKFSDVVLDFLGVCGYKTASDKEGYQLIIIRNMPIYIRFNKRNKSKCSGNIREKGDMFWFTWDKDKYPKSPFMYTKNDYYRRSRVGPALCQRYGEVIDIALE